MRSTQERVEAVNQRVKELEEQKRNKMQKIAMVGSVCVSLCLIFVLAYAVPVLIQNGLDGEYVTTNLSASIFADPLGLSYIIVGILSFILGACATVFCMILSKKVGGSDDS